VWEYENMKITANDLPLGCQVYKTLVNIQKNFGGTLSYGKVNSGYVLTLPHKINYSNIIVKKGDS